MSIAYWCLIAAALLPYLWVLFAKLGGPRFDNRDPRGWLSRQENPRIARANAAHLNAFEAFPMFAAGVLMAQFAGVETERVTMLALAFVAARVLHGVFYLANLAPLRSLAWLGGLVCTLALMVQAALAMTG
jgi:uncharacterized MAPEG superfamily protein